MVTALYPLAKSALDYSALPRPGFMVGTNLTDGATIPDNPTVFAKQLRSKGYTHIRLHHFDYLVHNNDTNKTKLANFIDALWLVGIRVTIDLYSKRWEQGFNGADYKVLLYNSDPTALEDYANYMKEIMAIPIGTLGISLAKHPAINLVTLINEGAHLTYNFKGAADRIASFYKTQKNALLNLGYTGFVSDASDILNIVDPQLAPVIENYDVVIAHTYGDHPDTSHREYLNTSMVFQGWQWGSILSYTNKTTRPVILEEYGALPFNSYRAVNGAFLALEAIRRRFAGAFGFAWATNMDNASKFSYTDWYAISTDDARVLTDQAMIALAYFAPDAPTSVQWGGDTGDWMYTYEYVSPHAKASINGKNGSLYVSKSGTLALSKGGLLFTFADCRPLNIEVSNTDSRTVVVNNGGTNQKFDIAPEWVTLPIGTRVTSAYDIDVRTGARLAKLYTTGNKVLRVGPLTEVVAS